MISRHQFRAGAIGQVKRAAVRVENAGRAFDNQPMQVVGPDRFAEGFAESVQEIEDQRFLDLNLLLRTFQRPNAPRHAPSGKNPARQRRDQQPEEKDWPHDGPASLLPRCSLDEGLALDIRERL